MAAVSIECGDFLEFQNALQKMRQVDDKIIYMLNAIIPTESFKAEVDVSTKCKNLFEQITSSHETRELAIKRCLNASKKKVKELKAERENGNNDPQLLKTLSNEQNTVRLLQSELNIEDVVKEHTDKIYRKKCYTFYKPPRNLKA